MVSAVVSPQIHSSQQQSENNAVEDAKKSEEELRRKRRALLRQSAKHPMKRRKLLQGNCEGEEKLHVSEPTVMRNVVVQSQKKCPQVSFDAKSNTTIPVQSYKDFSTEEYNSYYFKKEEYSFIKKDIQRTIDFLKSPNGKELKAGNDHDETKVDTPSHASEEHCTRGIESLAEDFVNDYKKRIQKRSKSAVFRFQKKQRRLEMQRRVGVEGNQKRDERTASSDEKATETLAEIYKKYTNDSEHIARRWGHFDAVDAGVDITSSSFSSAVVSPEGDSCTGSGNIMDFESKKRDSLSYVSCDGTEVSDNHSNKDENDDILISGDKKPFDSIQNILFDY